MANRHLDIRSLRAFVTVVETGSVTAAARRMCRTQPAITLQIRRLEEQVGKPLFEVATRRPQVTHDGEILLGYARAILQMHDEVWQRMQSRHIEGRVVLGTPDLYAAYLLPQILTGFRALYPGIEVDLRCALSRTLMNALDAKEIDIALVTAMPGIRAGEFVRKEPLVWVGGQDRAPYEENPVPLALLPPGNIYRDAALTALDSMGRPWRLACISESISGLQAAVFSGFAISVVAKSALVPGMRVLGRQESFPELPDIDVVLHRSPGRSSPAAQCLADFVVVNFIQRGTERAA
jgi:DNA-binding transcriptional LysR family regulator